MARHSLAGSSVNWCWFRVALLHISGAVVEPPFLISAQSCESVARHPFDAALDALFTRCGFSSQVMPDDVLACPISSDRRTGARLSDGGAGRQSKRSGLSDPRAGNGPRRANLDVRLGGDTGVSPAQQTAAELMAAEIFTSPPRESRGENLSGLPDPSVRQGSGVELKVTRL